MKVFLHTRSLGTKDWHNTPVDFARVPTVGEIVATASSSSWYEVQLVVHCGFECDFDAEVYAVKVDHLEVMKNAFIN